MLGLSLAATLALLAMRSGGPVAAPLGIGLGLYLILGSLNEIVTRSWSKGTPLAVAWRKARGLPRSAWGTALAHAGVGLTVIGIAATAWGVETIGSLKPGERLPERHEQQQRDYEGQEGEVEERRAD